MRGPHATLPFLYSQRSAVCRFRYHLHEVKRGDKSIQVRKERDTESIYMYVDAIYLFHHFDADSSLALDDI